MLNFLNIRGDWRVDFQKKNFSQKLNLWGGGGVKFTEHPRGGGVKFTEKAVPSVEFNERKIGADNEVGAKEWRVWILFELESATQLLYGYKVCDPEIL